MRRQHTAGLVLGVLVSIIPAACTRSDAGSGPDRTTSTSRPAAAVTTADIVSLIDPTADAQVEDRRLSAATSRQVARCMHAAGFEYVADDATGPTTDELFGTEPSLAARQELGYGLSPSHETDSPNDDYAVSLSEAENRRYSEALFGTDASAIEVEDVNGLRTGVNTDGCLADAHARLYGSAQAELELDALPSGHGARISKQVEASDELDAAWGAWATCMADAGYAYDDPEQPITELRARYEGAADDPEAVEAIEADEVDIAVADVRCRDEAGVGAIVREIERAYVDALPTTQRAQLARLVERRRAALATID